MGVQPPGQWSQGQQQGQPPGQWGPPPQRRNIWPIVLLLLLLLLGGGAASWFVLQKGDSGAGSMALAEGEVFMEPAAAVGPDPFSAQPVAPPPDPLIAKPALQQATRVEAPPKSSIQASSGAQPGLYGGTQNNAACDKAQLIAFLGANPDKANAWVTAQNADPTLRWAGSPEFDDRPGRYADARLDGLSALGSVLAPLASLADQRMSVLQTRALTVADIPAYIGTLTPLVLVADTRVTNHSYVAGQAPPRQSVMQKGTAVLVDVYGVPRARCYCGNPLLPPVPSTVQVVYVGNAWPDFNPGTVSVVSPAPQPITQFQVRLPDGTMLTIAAGGQPPAATAVATGVATVANATPLPTVTDQPTQGIGVVTAMVPPTELPTAVPPTPEPPTVVAPTPEPPTAPPGPTSCGAHSEEHGPQIEVTFVNNTSDTVHVVWIDENCNPNRAGTIVLAPGASQRGTTSAGALFRAETPGGAKIAEWRVPSGGGTFNIGP